MIKDDDGAIAQLGERYNGIVEVSGSIPLSSTIITYFLFPCFIDFAQPFVGGLFAP